MTTLAPCGTVSAYERHLRKGETPDAACREANRIRRNEYNSKPENRQRNAARVAAKTRAYRRLAEIHPDLFRALYAEELSVEARQRGILL